MDKKQVKQMMDEEDDHVADSLFRLGDEYGYGTLVDYLRYRWSEKLQEDGMDEKTADSCAGINAVAAACADEREKALDDVATLMDKLGATYETVDGQEWLGGTMTADVVSCHEAGAAIRNLGVMEEEGE